MSEMVPPPAGPQTTDSAPQQDTEPSPNHHTPAATVSISTQNGPPPPSNPLINSSPSPLPPQAQPPEQQPPQQGHLSQHMDPVQQLQHYEPPSSNSQATMNENQLNLPPIQSIESHPQSHQISQTHSQAPIGSSAINNPMNMPPPSIPQYYTMAGPIPSPDPYSMAGEPNRGLSSGRHKKEVKRRTKTGCLTCRKRRIK
ncbi:hypothetical protein ACJ72_02224, partial [Emergomyces africanus]